MAESKISRRTLLVVGCGVASAHAIGCGGAGAADIQLPSLIPAGAASSVAVGALHAVAGEPVAIARDSAGIYSMSLVCTHASCDLSGSASFSGMTCPCHGSVFDGQGNVLRGPASRALPHFAVTEDASGQLTIHTDQVVAPSARLPA